MKSLIFILKLIENLIPQRCHLCSNRSHGLLCDICHDGLYLSQKETCIDTLKITYLCKYDTENIKNMFRNIKFNNNKKLAHILSKKISSSLHLSDDSDVIYVPVPSHKKRIQSRGFNHITELFKDSVVQHKLCYVPLLIRVKHTRSLAGLSPQERTLELTQSFAINPAYHLDDFRDKHICIVDDIVTTGSTLDLCCKLLEKEGLNTISALCIASAH
jgi:competence protein ComFC